jgi:hypothetical protein
MRVRCPCGSSLFLVHTPPPKTPPGLRKVYLICDKCRKIWKLQDASLPDTDAYGVLKSENELQPSTVNQATRTTITLKRLEASTMPTNASSPRSLRSADKIPLTPKTVANNVVKPSLDSRAENPLNWNAERMRSIREPKNGP